VFVAASDDYFSCRWDESGSDPGTEARSKSDRPILMVAGYLAHVNEWEALEKRWKEIVIDDYGLQRFHMANFCNRKKPYSLLSDDRYNLLISSLLDAIRDYPRMYSAWSLEIDDYMEVIKAKNLLRTDIVRAYHILARRCMDMISAFAKLAGHQNKILHVFDQGNAAWPSFEATFTEAMRDALCILQPISQDNRDIVSLQAADVLVHQLARHRVMQLDGSVKTLRMYTDRLKGKPGFVKNIERDELREIYEEEKVFEAIRPYDMYLPRRRKYPATEAELWAMAEIFKTPNEYQLHRLRELQ
jgi:hypothetical protein